MPSGQIGVKDRGYSETIKWNFAIAWSVDNKVLDLPKSIQTEGYWETCYRNSC